MLSYDFSDILTVIPPSRFFLLSIVKLYPFLTSNICTLMVLFCCPLHCPHLLS